MHKLLLIAAAVLPLCGSAWAATAAKDSAQATPRPATTEEIRALGAAQAATKKGVVAAKPVAQRLADGAEMVMHDETMLNYSVVTRLPDGGITSDCVIGEAAAKQLMKGKRALAASKDKTHNISHNHNHAEEQRNDR